MLLMKATMVAVVVMKPTKGPIWSAGQAWFSGQRPDAGDAVQKQDPLEVAVDQPDRGEQAQDEHGGQHDGDEGHEQLGGLRGKPQRDQRTGQREQVEGRPGAYLAGVAAERALQHEVFSGQR